MTPQRKRLRKILRLLLWTFPEDVRGIRRTDMEVAFMDGLRELDPGARRINEGRTVRDTRAAFIARELWGFFRGGIMERMEGWKEDHPGTGSRPSADRFMSEDGEGGRGGGSGPGIGRGGGGGFLPVLGDDLRGAGRRLRKSPAFSATVVLILSVGIGATVAMFSVLDAALLRALPYPDPEELVLGSATFQGEWNMTCSFPDYLDHRDGTDALEVMAAMLPGTTSFPVTGGDTPERAAVHWVTSDFFQALEVPPAVGRHFLPEEGERGAPDVAILSHGFWQRWFGGDPDVVGRTLTVDGYQTTVVGVMPAGFRFRNDTDLWAPVRPGLMDTEGRRSHSWQVVGRLRDGVTLEQAQAQMDVVSAQLSEEYPVSHAGKGMGLMPLGEALAESYRPALLLLMAATGLLLLIACGNVAGLLVARATARKAELSIRAALGASRRTLARQLFAESLLLAAFAGTGGSLLALWLQRLTLSALPLDLLGVTELGLSGPMLAFSLLISLGTAVLFGAGPALTASLANPAEDLKGGRRATSGKSGGRVRGGLVVAQVALSVVLLTGSGLLIRSFVRLQAVDMGFQPQGLITANIAVPGPGYPEADSRTGFFQGVMDDVSALPGVVSASFIDMVPIRHRYRNWFVWDPNRPPEDLEGRVSTFSRTVMPGYFEAMGIPLLQGRDHELEDGPREEPYLVISESAARALFPQEDPIGRTVTVFNGMGNSDHEILGVVRDIRMTQVGREPSPQMYYSHVARRATSMNLVVRVHSDPGDLVPSIRRAVLDRDPDIPLANVSMMTDIISDSISETRILGLATGLFAATALLLSMAGLYAVLAYYVVRRTQEIGIRVAFGATGGRVLRMVVRRGMVLVGVGLVLGLVGAGASGRILQSQLFGVGAVDPVTMGIVAGAFLIIGTFAALLPALRASRVDPLEAIQLE